MEQWGILWTNLDNSRDSAQWRKVWALVLVGATRCWRRCECRGFFYVCVKVVRAYPVSPCFTCSSIGQEPDCCWLVVGGFGLGCVVCVVCCLCCFVFSAPGLSFWSSCPTMTTLAQLHDCHSCNDERSKVQKKNQRLRRPVLYTCHCSPSNWAYHQKISSSQIAVVTGFAAEIWEDKVDSDQSFILVIVALPPNN